MTSFCKHLENVKTITQEDQKLCDFPITITEIKEAIERLKCNHPVMMKLPLSFTSSFLRFSPHFFLKYTLKALRAHNYDASCNIDS